MCNAILFGFKGVGKSYFGKRLAKRLSQDFYDIDLVMEQLFRERTKTSCTCQEIFKAYGSSYFRNLEKAAVTRLQGLTKVVIACGGGTLMDAINYTALKKMGVLIYLQASLQAIQKRIDWKKMTLVHDRHALEVLYQTRIPVYEKLADYTLHLDGQTNESILSQLREMAHG